MDSPLIRLPQSDLQVAERQMLHSPRSWRSSKMLLYLAIYCRSMVVHFALIFTNQQTKANHLAEILCSNAEGSALLASANS